MPQASLQNPNISQETIDCEQQTPMPTGMTEYLPKFESSGPVSSTESSASEDDEYDLLDEIDNISYISGNSGS